MQFRLRHEYYRFGGNFRFYYLLLYVFSLFIRLNRMGIQPFTPVTISPYPVCTLLFLIPLGAMLGYNIMFRRADMYLCSPVSLPCTA